VGGGGRIHEADYSLVDYNRAGVPLVEIVSAPDIRSAEQARAYVDELRAILVAVGASDGKMEEGSLRVDANVSVRPAGSAEFGTRCEIKNMNSLRSLGRAIEYEATRQVSVLTEGGTVVQETRHWDEGAGRTGSMRSKEEAYDYRYFPEPDLVPVEPSEEWIESVAASMPRLPAERRAVVGEASGMAPESDPVVTVVRLGLDRYVSTVIEGGGGESEAAIAVRRLANEVAADVESAGRLTTSAFARLVALEADGSLTPAQARTVLKDLLDSGGDPDEIAARHGFEAMAAGDLEAVLDRVISDHPAEWTRYAGGEDKLMGFFIGQVKSATDGRADLKLASALLRSRRG
jgi:aspartyl-tRNA(Asn)/glutamyl-tRNA(Gln) amidotransferase subunit B